MKRTAGTESDETLMLAVANGRLEAFEVLVQRHQTKVYRIVYQMLGSEEDAWDVSQEVFIKVYQARKKYVVDAKFTTWLYRIANNAAIDRIRQNQRQNKVISVEEESMPEPQTPIAGAEDNMELIEMTHAMTSALSSLSERQRGMVVMKYCQGFSVAEIADVFDCAAGTVKATLFQALRNLRKTMTQKGMTYSEADS